MEEERKMNKIMSKGTDEDKKEEKLKKPGRTGFGVRGLGFETNSLQLLAI
jgi:hypothetical protein